jgi:hypothetical protein
LLKATKQIRELETDEDYKTKVPIIGFSAFPEKYKD